MKESDELMLKEILSSPEILEKLLILEKRKRGINKDKLVFIGMADTALYWWCGMKSLLKNRKMELAYFTAYLEDRIRYSLELGLIKKLPSDYKALLNIGNEITFQDIEKLLKNQEGRICEVACEDLHDKEGNIIRVINPKLPPEIIKKFKREAMRKHIKIGTIKEIADPLRRGEFVQGAIAEKYPTIRWNFNWDRYVIIGVPDGITKEFVYEFKTTNDEFFLFFVKPVALAQGDLYGHFFKRKKKKVQIYVVKTEEILTFEEPISEKRAIETLKNFKKIDEGNLPKSPQRWKCKKCEFIDVCPIIKKRI